MISSRLFAVFAVLLLALPFAGCLRHQDGMVMKAVWVENEGGGYSRENGSGGTTTWTCRDGPFLIHQVRLENHGKKEIEVAESQWALELADGGFQHPAFIDPGYVTVFTGGYRTVRVGACSTNSELTAHAFVRLYAEDPFAEPDAALLGRVPVKAR